MNVTCGVKSCIYNEANGQCYANKISVGKQSATNTKQTKCNTYVPDHRLEFSEFAVEFLETAGQALKVSNIKCGAIKCRHNKNKSCMATRVTINPKTATCDTFVPKY